MQAQHYSTSFTVDQTPAEVFKAVTHPGGCRWRDTRLLTALCQ